MLAFKRAAAKAVMSFVAITAAVTISGCPSPTISVGSMHPPQWIQGKWQLADGSGTFTFSADNAMMQISFMTIDFQKSFSSYMTEESSGSLYTVKVAAPGTSAQYDFEKVDDKTATYTNTTNGTKLGAKTMNKQ